MELKTSDNERVLRPLNEGIRDHRVEASQTGKKRPVAMNPGNATYHVCSSDCGSRLWGRIAICKLSLYRALAIVTFI